VEINMLKIQPVSKGYFPSMKVGLREIAAKRRAGTVIYAERFNHDGSVTPVFLIPEGSSTTPRVGLMYDAQHLRSKRPYGEHAVLAVFDLKFKSGVLSIGDAQPGTAEYSAAFDLEAVAFEMA
jgi:hypothetical protein